MQYEWFWQKELRRWLMGTQYSRVHDFLQEQGVSCETLGGTKYSPNGLVVEGLGILDKTNSAFGDTFIPVRKKFDTDEAETRRVSPAALAEELIELCKESEGEKESKPEIDKGKFATELQRHTGAGDGA